MHWFFFVILAEFLWSSGNFIDKFLITKYLKGAGIGSLVIFSSLISALVLPIVVIIDPNVFQINLNDKLLLITAGIVYASIWVVPYFNALTDDDASVVVPIFQLIPVFSYILGLIFLNETLTPEQIAGSFLIILGAVIISVNLKSSRIKMKLLGLMLLSSFSVALSNLLFKLGSLDTVSFSTSIFWEYIGVLITTLLYFVFIKSYRQQFLMF